MAEVVILGCANAVPDLHHDNAHIYLSSGSHKVLIDCGSMPIQRLQQLGLGCEDLTDIILTHFHPDHVATAPLLLMGLWLMGRKKTLMLYGIPHVIDRLITTMELFDWESWPNFYPINFQHIPESPMSMVIDTLDLRVYGSPVRHLIPTMGFRFELKNPHRVVTYSCDTEPCPEVVELAQECDVLIHESAGDLKGHTSPSQAGAVAQEAGAKTLCLIHYPTGADPQKMIEEARREFAGRVFVAVDGMSVDLG